MKHLTQPNNYSCLPTAFAMVTESTVEHYFAEIGHDGSEIWNPNVPEPLNHKCFVPSECFGVAYSLGYLCHEVLNGFECVVVPGITRIVNPCLKDIYAYMCWHKGVIFGKHKMHSSPHAMSWDGAEVLDPKGFKACKESYDIDSFIIIEKRK